MGKDSRVSPKEPGSYRPTDDLIAETVWPQYTPEDNVSDAGSLISVRADTDIFNQNIIQLDSTAFANSSFAEFNIIPDTFRAEEMSFINSVAAAFAE